MVGETVVTLRHTHNDKNRYRFFCLEAGFVIGSKKLKITSNEYNYILKARTFFS